MDPTLEDLDDVSSKGNKNISIFVIILGVTSGFFILFVIVALIYKKIIKNELK